jgi:hypothetical protein
MEFIPELRDMSVVPLASATSQNRQFPGRVVEVHKGEKGSARGNSEEEQEQTLPREAVVLGRGDKQVEVNELTAFGVGSIPMSVVETYTSGGRMHSERLDFAARTIVLGDEVAAARRAARGLRAYVEGYEFRFRADYLEDLTAQDPVQRSSSSADDS